MMTLLIAILTGSFFSAWLIGKAVFSVLEKKGIKWANSASLFASLASLIGIFVLVMIAIDHSGGFRR